MPTFARRVALLAAFVAPCVPCAAGADEWLVTDRGFDCVWRLADLDASAAIADPAEVFLFFSVANAAGTLGPQNPTCLAVGPGRRVLMGDQINRCVYLLRDLNNDGDAQDAGESVVFADQTNASGASFAFPTGAAFDQHAVAYISNAGNASGPDAIYRFEDLNADGDANDAGEVTVFVSFGGVNSNAWSPQEIEVSPDVHPAGRTIYFRNSIASNQGVFYQPSIPAARGVPAFPPFFNSANMSGIAPAPGFALERDRTRTISFGTIESMYTLQTLSGGVDQLLRMGQPDFDGDANDAGEARSVWTNAASVFTAIDVVSMPARGGPARVLVTDNSGPSIVALDDLDASGDFLGAGEASTFFSNSAGTMSDIRQMSIYRLACPADLDGDGQVGATDLAALLGSWGSGPGPADISGDGDVGAADLAALLGSWGACPEP